MNTAVKSINKILFDQLFKIVDPKLKSFKNDLYKWDKMQILNLEPGAEFIHITRETGTELIKLNMKDENLKGLEAICTIFNYRIQHNYKLILYFNGSELKKITEARARVIFYNEIDKRQEAIKREQDKQD